MKEGANVYSRQWFEFFHQNIDEGRTSREVNFVCRYAPQSEFQKILDVCCGMGRHSRALSKCGYAVTGIDRDIDAVATARQLTGGASYIIADIRDYQLGPESLDAVIVMGQSFGHFDEATNLDILRRLADGVRKRGRIILDLWDPEFFKVHQEARDLNTSRGVVRESKRVEDDRLFVELQYPDGTEEKFEWQLFKPPEMERFAEPLGLVLSISCSNFDKMKTPSSTEPRIQFVLERET
jgi:SAM-dependent methyltransferase